MAIVTASVVSPESWMLLASVRWWWWWPSFDRFRTLKCPLQSLAMRLDMPEPHDLLAYRKEVKQSTEAEEKPLFTGEVLVKRVG